MSDTQQKPSGVVGREPLRRPFNRNLSLAAVGLVMAVTTFAMALILTGEREAARQTEDKPREVRKEAPRPVDPEAIDALLAIRRQREERQRTRERRESGAEVRRESGGEERRVEDFRREQEAATRKVMGEEQPPIPEGNRVVAPSPMVMPAPPRILLRPTSTKSVSYQGAIAEQERLESRDQELRAPRVVRVEGPALMPGAVLRAVLIHDVDTRLGATIVVRTTHDEPVADGRVLPAGTMLLGEIEGSPQVGLRQVPVRFRRIAIPGGAVGEIDAMATNAQGVLGIDARYRSNLLRALLPSLGVTAAGAYLDDRYGRNRPPSQGIGGSPIVVESPSVVQRIVPQLEQEIRSRYGTARPYYLIGAGRDVNILVTEVIRIPEGVLP